MGMDNRWMGPWQSAAIVVASQLDFWRLYSIMSLTKLIWLPSNLMLSNCCTLSLNSLDNSSENFDFIDKKSKLNFARQFSRQNWIYWEIFNINIGSLAQFGAFSEMRVKDNLYRVKSLLWRDCEVFVWQCVEVSVIRA